MPGFDVHAPDLSLTESLFLEASAGTGKTYTIEHLVLRLLKSGIELNEILVVTFTRAATLELKTRIRSHLPDEPFDESKIWTLHSFCFQMLRTYALETGFSFDQEEESASPAVLRQIVRDAIRNPTEFTPKQLEKVIQGDPDRLVQRLMQQASTRLPIEVPNWDFEIEKLDPEKLYEDLIRLAPQFGKQCDRSGALKSEVVEGIEACCRLFSEESVDPVDLPLLQFVESNRLKRSRPVENLHYPGLLERWQRDLIPKLATFSDPLAIFAHLAEKTRLHLEKVVAEEGIVFFEDLIRMMAHHVKNPLFAQKVRSQFKAVLIDEFQDTDPLQWEIFSTLFLTPDFEGPLYLVGDPKQSIYRFRQADLYTFMRAKKLLPNRSLSTNYRSAPPLVDALGELFTQAGEFITLPKTKESIACEPVKAAASIEPIGDGKECLHFLEAEDEKSLFSTIIHEIHRLHEEQNIPYSACAILVRDRFQAQRFQASCSLPLVSRKSQSLLDSPGYDALVELVDKVENQRFSHGDPEQIGRWRHLLHARGILPLFYDAIEPGYPHYDAMLQLAEMTARSRQDPLYHLQSLKRLDPESPELRERAQIGSDAIQLMTLHVSKGLEFPVVFPVGLIAPFKKRKNLIQTAEKFVLSDEQAEEEERSEQMRQLYVACTRAKRRLYLPVLPHASPLSYFLEKVGPFSKGSREQCANYPAPSIDPPSCPPPIHLNPPSYAPLSLHSYSSLVPHEPRVKASAPESTFPAGALTGTLIHELLEKLPFTGPPCTKPYLKGTHLEPWSEEISQLLTETFKMRLPAGFSLDQVDPSKIEREMEFLFPSEEPAGFYKGFIDLFFEHEGKYYLIDWKTNYVGPDETVEEVIERHRYDVQAKIYHLAAHKYLRLFYDTPPIGGIYYVFIRSQQVISMASNNRL